MGALTEKLFAQHFPNTEEEMYTFLRTMLNDTATSAELDDIADPINVTRKYVGKTVFNTTSGLLVVADGAATNGTWSSVSDGLVDHTPS